MTAAMISLIAAISEAVGRLEAGENASLLRLRRINRIRTVQGSLAIEGNTLSIEQITAIIEGKRVIAPPREILEVRNAVKIYEMLDRLRPESSSDLLLAHKVLMSGLAEDAGNMNLTGRLKNKKHELKMAKLAGLLPVWIAAACLVLTVVLLFVSRDSMQAELAVVNSQLGFLKMNTDAAMIKLSKHRATTETQIKLSPQARKVLEPIMKARTATADALFHTVDKQPAGLKIEEVLVRCELEAESIALASKDSNTSQDGEPDQETASPFVSRLSPETGDEQQLREGLKGQILIIKGTADTPVTVGQYAENLTGRRAIKRIRSLNTRKSRASGVEFLLKGELP